MIEDKLKRAERIRLEALAQSVASQNGFQSTPEGIIERAMKFETFIKEARADE